MDRPDWWDWEIELTLHAFKRMGDRDFNEADLRIMLDDAQRIVAQPNGRYRVETALEGRAWLVIVEPEPRAEVILVITAYPRPTS